MIRSGTRTRGTQAAVSQGIVARQHDVNFGDNGSRFVNSPAVLKLPDRPCLSCLYCLTAVNGVRGCFGTQAIALTQYGASQGLNSKDSQDQVNKKSVVFEPKRGILPKAAFLGPSWSFSLLAVANPRFRVYFLRTKSCPSGRIASSIKEKVTWVECEK